MSAPATPRGLPPAAGPSPSSGSSPIAAMRATACACATRMRTRRATSPARCIRAGVPTTCLKDTPIFSPGPLRAFLALSRAELPPFFPPFPFARKRTRPLRPTVPLGPRRLDDGGLAGIVDALTLPLLACTAPGRGRRDGRRGCERGVTPPRPAALMGETATPEVVSTPRSCDVFCAPCLLRGDLELLPAPREGELLRRDVGAAPA